MSKPELFSEIDGEKCRCLYETINNLPISKFCIITCGELEILKTIQRGCQCQYEIENSLPRTKFCLVPCKQQTNKK